MGGSSSPNITTPTPPPAPASYQSQIQDYIKSLPDLLHASQQYDPQFSQLNFDINKQLYPQTAGLQEQLAGIASHGMTDPMPIGLQQQYMSDFNAGIGANVNAPIGVSTRTQGLMQLQEDWRRYYQNLALSTSGRQPLALPGNNTQAGVPGALSYGAQTYGAYAPAFAQQNTIASPRTGASGVMSGLGTLGGGILGASLGGPFGAAVGGSLGGYAGGALGGGFK